MRFNSSKSVVMRVGARFKLLCEPVMLGDKPLSFVNEAKYLGVCLLSGSKFKVSLHHMKRNFFAVLTPFITSACRDNRETVVL